MVAFYLDLDQRRMAPTRAALAGRGHSAVGAAELRVDPAADVEQLYVAAQAGCALVTSKAGTYRLLHKAWRRWVAHREVLRHGGIILVPRAWSPEEIAERLDALVRSGVPLADGLHMWSGSAWAAAA